MVNVCTIAEVLPTRTQLLDPALWQTAGFDPGDARRYCSAHTAAMSHPNLHVQLRIPGASAMVGLFGTISRSLFAANSSISAIFPAIQPQALAILNTSFGGNTTALRLEYWSSIVSACSRLSLLSLSCKPVGGQVHEDPRLIGSFVSYKKWHAPSPT
jgi:hypothetical protein